MEPDPLPLITVVQQGIQIYPAVSALIAVVLVIILLLFLSALIAGSEAAYFSLDERDRQKLDRRKDNSAGSVRRHLENPEKLLATILVANNFVLIAVVILSVYTAGVVFDFSKVHTVGSILGAAIFAGILLLFGKILPKVYASRHAIRIACMMARPLRIMELLFRPLNGLVIHALSVAHRRSRSQSQNISLDDLSHALELNESDERYDDKGILEGIIKFGDKSAAEIMQSRVDVVALNLKDSFEKVINVINDSGYSRIPVYSGSFDNIRGILYIKDLLPFIHDRDSFRWQSIIRPPFFVPEAKKINDLLEEFQKNKVHMAIVVDEYGGSSGIVTLEDILEEIVGDLLDEFDEDENYSTRISENKYLFDGKIPLNDFYRITGSDTHIFEDCKGDADTLAGLILEVKGEIPALHEKIVCKNFMFKIDAVDNRRIKKIRVEIT